MYLEIIACSNISFITSFLGDYMSTWSCENRVSKHFVIFLKFPSNSLFTVVCLGRFFVFVLWLGICVEVDVDRITILPSLFFHPYPQFSLTQKWQLFEISVFLMLVSEQFSSLRLDIGHLWDGSNLLQFAESTTSNMVLYSRFIWPNGSITLNPSWDRKARYWQRWPLRLWPQEQVVTSQLN